MAEGQPRLLCRREAVHDAGEAVQAGQRAALLRRVTWYRGEPLTAGRPDATPARRPPRAPRPPPALPWGISGQYPASKLLPLAGQTGLPQSACKTARGQCRPVRPRSPPKHPGRAGGGPSGALQPGCTSLPTHGPKRRGQRVSRGWGACRVP